MQKPNTNSLKLLSLLVMTTALLNITQVSSSEQKDNGVGSGSSSSSSSSSSGIRDIKSLHKDKFMTVGGLLSGPYGALCVKELSGAEHTTYQCTIDPIKAKIIIDNKIENNIIKFSISLEGKEPRVVRNYHYKTTSRTIEGDVSKPTPDGTDKLAHDFITTWRIEARL